MNKLISNSEIITLSRDFEIKPVLVKTILMTESSNSGFDNKGRLKIQFEPHEFHKRLLRFGVSHTYVFDKENKKYEITAKNITIRNGVETQNPEYVAFDAARQIHNEAALLSTSYGLFQVMGYNHVAAGYKTVQAMYNEFCLSEFFQAKGGLNFIKYHREIYVALKTGNARRFCELYNGPKFEELGYLEKWKTNYSKALKLYGQII
jgi:hypothetical protein